jgi:membrane protease subunit HflC
MKSCISVVIIFFMLVGLIILGDSYFIVNEGNKAIVTRFGAPVGEVREPGLNFKTPFIEEVLYFDTRIMKWDGEATQIPTKEKSNIFVDCTARWRIVDPLRFLQRVGNVNKLNNVMNDVIDSAVRVSISSNYLADIVRSEVVNDDPSSNIINENPESQINGNQIANNQNRKNREQILNEILEKSKPPKDEPFVFLLSCLKFALPP